jgi:hypothetical protein
LVSDIPAGDGKMANSFLQCRTAFSKGKIIIDPLIDDLMVVSSEKVSGSGVSSVLGTWYGDVVMGVLLSFDEAAILYRDFNSAPFTKAKYISICS